MLHTCPIDDPPPGVQRYVSTPPVEGGGKSIKRANRGVPLLYPAVPPRVRNKKAYGLFNAYIRHGYLDFVHDVRVQESGLAAQGSDSNLADMNLRNANGSAHSPKYIPLNIGRPSRFYMR